jgi:hypothetical protein
VRYLGKYNRVLLNMPTDEDGADELIYNLRD